MRLKQDGAHLITAEMRLTIWPLALRCSSLSEVSGEGGDNQTETVATTHCLDFLDLTLILYVRLKYLNFTLHQLTGLREARR